MFKPKPNIVHYILTPLNIMPFRINLILMLTQLIIAMTFEIDENNIHWQSLQSLKFQRRFMISLFERLDFL